MSYLGNFFVMKQNQLKEQPDASIQLQLFYTENPDW